MISIGISKDSTYSATVTASKPTHSAIRRVDIPDEVRHSAIRRVDIPDEVRHSAIQPGHRTALQKDQESQKNQFGDILKETIKTASASSPRGQALTAPNPIGAGCFDLSWLVA